VRSLNCDFVPNFVCLTIRFKTPLVPYVSGEGGLNGALNGELNGDVSGDVNGDVNSPINGLVNGPVNSLSGVLREVYLIVLRNPGIKIKQVAELRGKPESTVKKQLTALRKKDFIEYRGSDKTGGYYPVKK